MTARTKLSGKSVRNGEAPGRLRRALGVLGPGLITGAADDDPSGISTYSVAGAAYGYSTLWIALLTFPLMAAIQLMCARLGMVTRRGLAAAVRIYYPRWVLWGSCAILVVANVINIGADLGGMAEATQLVTGIRSTIWIPLYALFILGLLFWASYKLITRIFKWLTLVLFAYVLASFYAHVDWKQAAEALRPLAGNGAYLLFTLGLIGTGMLGVPVLMGSCAYAVAEGAAWRGSMADKPRSARKFYAVMAVAMGLGLALNFAQLNAVKMLFWSAVINGLLAPPLSLLVVLLTSSRKVISRLLGYLGWATLGVMTAAAVGMIVTP